MTIYELEFNYFDGACWEQQTKRILAQSIIQLMKCFIEETYCIHLQTTKQCWNVNKKHIICLNFPIVVTIN